MNDLTDKLIELKRGLQRNNPLFCGAAPAWIIEIILPRLDEVIAKSICDGQNRSQLTKSFVMGAGRFIADQGGMYDCDNLLSRLHELDMAAD